MSRLNYYETLYLTPLNLGDEERAKVESKIRETISNHEGEVFKSDKWAERNLSYMINHQSKGIYYIMIYKALPGVVAEIEKNLKFLNNEVLRFITLRIKEDAALKHRPVAETGTAEGGL